MSLYWSTKSYGGRNYIVIQHPLKDVSTNIFGIKFHCGYGVVVKGSKEYKNLRTIPVLRKAREFPLTILKNLKFIIRSKDIEMIYGKDVYISYQRSLLEYAKKQDAEKHEETATERSSENSTKCKHLLLNQQFCSNERVPGSTGYCRTHIMDDLPLIQEMGVEIPNFVGKPGFGKETTDFFAKVCKQIEKASKTKARRELEAIIASQPAKVEAVTSETATQENTEDASAMAAASSRSNKWLLK
jgi:hypothetical protein